jgi:hypothetical protein
MSGRLRRRHKSDCTVILLNLATIPAFPAFGVNKRIRQLDVALHFREFPFQSIRALSFGFEALLCRAGAFPLFTMHAGRDTTELLTLLALALVALLASIVALVRFVLGFAGLRLVLVGLIASRLNLFAYGLALGFLFLKVAAFETFAHLLERSIGIVLEFIVAHRIAEDSTFGIRDGSIHVLSKLPFGSFVLGKLLRSWCHETHVLLFVNIVDMTERPKAAGYPVRSLSRISS